MSGRHRRFQTEFMVEAAHRVTDAGLSITEVVVELLLGGNAFGAWVCAERARLEAAKDTGVETLAGAEQAELFRLRKRVIEQERVPILMGNVSAYFAGNP